MPVPSEIAAFRFGYGLPASGPVDPAGLLAGLAGPDTAARRWPAHGTADILPLIADMREARDDGNAMEPGSAGAKAAGKALRRAIKATKALGANGARVALARAIGSDTPLRERLAWFWGDHFTVTPRNRTQYAWPTALVEEAVRPHLGGRFARMLQSVVMHPAMLIYLDQTASMGPNSRLGSKRGTGLNENLAREVLELHTLGVGAGYTQADVRELAKLFTGLMVMGERGFVFDDGRVEPGSDRVMGVDYGGEGLAPILRALEDLSVHPATARHLAGKLAAHFVGDTPDPALVDALAAEWLRSGGDLAAVTGALLAHPAAWNGAAQKARQPFDFVAAALRALGCGPDAVMELNDADLFRLLLDPMKAMGQEWQFAAGPDGWPEEAEAWITPSGLAARMDWAMTTPAELLAQLPEAREFAVRALGSRAGAALMRAVEGSESRAEALALVLASPAFNRR